METTDHDLHERGIALLTVIWILALMAALVGAMAVSSYFHIQVSSAISEVGRSTDIAESGLQAWMANLRADAIRGDSGVVITEVMNHNPANSCGGLTITKVCLDCSEEFVEIYNKGPNSARLGKLLEEGTVRWPDSDNVGNRLVMPGEYIVIADGSVAGADYNVTLNLANSDDGVLIEDPRGNQCDRVGYADSGNNSDVAAGYYEINVVDPGGDNIQRKTAGLSNIPKDLNRNDTDFEQVSSPTPRTGYDSVPSTINYGPDDGAYVELYNTGNDTEDLTLVSDFKIYDSHDSAGNEITGAGGPTKYKLVQHSEDPFPGAASGNLAPGQVGLILHSNADTKLIGVDDWINKKKGRVYALQPVGGGAAAGNQFFNGGLHNRTLETITFEKLTSDQTVVESSNDWDTFVAINSSRDKDVLHLPDHAQYWPISAYTGTPGFVTTGLDHHGGIWSWGGTINNGSTFNEKIYVPSMENTRQSGDFGYFKFQHIEDETGKINLVLPGRDGSDPSDTYELTPEDPPTYRALTMSKVPDALAYSSGKLDVDTHWLSYGDFVTNNTESPPDALLTESLSQWDEYSHVYTGYRQDGSIHVLNINTAPYEALKTLPIKPYNAGNAPNFITSDMALEIIEHRSQDPAQQNDDNHYTIPLETYGNNSSEGIRSYNALCKKLSSMEPNFDCVMFKKHATLGSQGVFRAVVTGVSLDATGDTLGSSTLEAVVNRRPVENKTGPLEIIYKRKQ